MATSLQTTFSNAFYSEKITGGHRTRVAAVTLDNMAEDAVAASASLRQILTVSVRYCGPAFVSWLSMLWDTLTRNPELQWFGISLQFRLKLSRGDEAGGCRWCLFSRGRGCRSVLTRVPLCTDERRASLILKTAVKLGIVYIFLGTKSHLTFYHILIWSFGHNCIIDWPGKAFWGEWTALNSFSLRITCLHMLANTNCLVNLIVIDYSAIH